MLICKQLIIVNLPVNNGRNAVMMVVVEIVADVHSLLLTVLKVFVSKSVSLLVMIKSAATTDAEVSAENALMLPHTV